MRTIFRFGLYSGKYEQAASDAADYYTALVAAGRAEVGAGELMMPPWVRGSERDLWSRAYDEATQCVIGFKGSENSESDTP